MYYSILIETTEKEKKGKITKNKEILEIDKTDLPEIEARIIKPFLSGEKFQFNGYFLDSGKINRIIIKQTEKSISVIAREKSAAFSAMTRAARVFATSNFTPLNVIHSNDNNVIDITTTVFDRVKKAINS
jgi:hypothetical protein